MSDRGNIEWLLEDAPELFTPLAEQASRYVCHPRERMQWRDDFSDLVGRYNRVARDAGKETVQPTEMSLFAKEITEYLFTNRNK